MDFKDKAKAAAKNVEGKVQEAASHVTGDPQDKIRGQAKQDEAAEMYARRDAEQDITSGQVSMPGTTPAQSSYSTSDRDPLNYPQGATPSQAPMPGSTPDQIGYDVSERGNYPQGVTPGQAPVPGHIPTQPDHDTSDEDVARDRLDRS